MLLGAGEDGRFGFRTKSDFHSDVRQRYRCRPTPARPTTDQAERTSLVWIFDSQDVDAAECSADGLRDKMNGMIGDIRVVHDPLERDVNEQIASAGNVRDRREYTPRGVCLHGRGECVHRARRVRTTRTRISRGLDRHGRYRRRDDLGCQRTAKLIALGTAKVIRRL